MAGNGRLVDPSGRRIPTEEEKRAFASQMQAAQAEIRFGRLALQAIAVLLYEKKTRKRAIPKATMRAIVEQNLNLVIREDGENVYLELREPEPIEQERTDGSDR